MESKVLMRDFIIHLFSWCCHLEESVVERPVFIYNPIWWLSIGACACCLIPGKWFHALFGQGGEVRDDEEVVEQKARVGWVYTYSGGFVICCVIDVLTLVILLLDDERGNASEVRSTLIALAIEAWYLVGDWNLLYRMSTRDTLLMHSAVVSRIAYGLAFVVIFVLGLFSPNGRRAMEPDTQEDWRAQDITLLTSLMRIIFCLFMLVAYVGYLPLLSLKYNSDVDGAEVPWTVWKMRAITLVGLVSVVVEGIVFTSYGSQPKWLLGQLGAVVVVAVLMEARHPSRKKILAALTALFPYVVVGSAFMYCGPDMWNMLAGS